MLIHCLQFVSLRITKFCLIYIYRPPKYNAGGYFVTLQLLNRNFHILQNSTVYYNLYKSQPCGPIQNHFTEFRKKKGKAIPVTCR
jgi:hypothetical protein